MSWTDERVELLTKLSTEGLSASRIAAGGGDGVARHAGIGKVHRRKLAARARPASAAPRPRAVTRPSLRRTGGSMSPASAGAMKRRVRASAPSVGATALKPQEDA